MRRKRVALEALYQLDDNAPSIPVVGENAYADTSNSGQTQLFPVKWIQKVLPEMIERELSERQREILLRYYYQNMTIREIASDLHMAPSSVCRSIQRSRNILARFLRYYHL